VDQARGSPVDSDDAAATGTLDHVRLKAGAVVDVDDMRLLAG